VTAMNSRSATRESDSAGQVMLGVLRACCIIVLMAGPLTAECASEAAGNVDQRVDPLAWLKSGDYETVNRYFEDLQHRYETGGLSDQQLYQGFHALYEDEAGNARYFNQWVQAHPDSYVARVARGTYYYRMAMAARSDDYVTRQSAPIRARRIESYFALARPDLKASLKLTARPYLSALYLLNVEIVGGSPDLRRQWLDLGTSIDPKGVMIRKRYLISLQPLWGGSIDQMRAYIDECAQQGLPAPTMAALRLVLANELVDALRQDAGAEERLKRWGDVIELSQAAGEKPPLRAMGGYAISAWDLNRREDADRMLARLEAMDVDDGFVLSQMGWIYIHEQRMQEAWKAVTRGANLDDAWSQLAVGQTLLHGCADINLSPDRLAALAWIKRAAYLGNAEALALMCRLVLLATLFIIGLVFIALRLARRQSQGRGPHPAAAADSSPSAALLRPPEPLKFNGSGAEYFGIWIVNLLLTILTLGIYSAWAKVRRLQYFYRQTELAGSSFDFHGSPWRILVGRLIALSMLIAYHYSARLFSFFTVVMVGSLMVVMPWLLRNSLRFRLYNSSWRGTRFYFRGTPAGAYRVFLLNGILAFFSFYILAPFTHQRLKAYQHDNSWFGRARFSFHATVDKFYPVYMLWLLPVGAVAILFPVTGFGEALTGLARMQQQGGRVDPHALLQILLPLYVSAILVWFVFWSTFHALITNLIWSNTRLGEHRVICDMSPVDLISINVGNFVLVALTLGLFIPWARVRLARFQLNAVRVLPASDLQDFESAGPETIGAVGEEATGLFDFDISL
jgi:uncharacterized membrane protein YjgN (DUF898 family)